MECGCRFSLMLSVVVLTGNSWSLFSFLCCHYFIKLSYLAGKRYPCIFTVLFRQIIMQNWLCILFYLTCITLSFVYLLYVYILWAMIIIIFCVRAICACAQTVDAISCPVYYYSPFSHNHSFFLWASLSISM